MTADRASTTSERAPTRAPSPPPSTTYRATLIPGDGIGPEITEQTVRALEALGLTFAWDEQIAGMTAVEKTGTPLPDATVESIRQTGLALKGPLTTPVGTGFRSVNVGLRKAFELYANVRPAKTIVPGQRYEGIDIVLVRENIEGLYAGVEHYIGIGADPHAVGESVAIVTRSGSERIIRHAFEYALTNGRTKVTCVHKANILKMTSGLFLEVAREIAKEYEGRVEFGDMIVDNCAMQLVMRPEQFDVIVTTNLFGDILSDEISGLVGGLGLAPGANIGQHAAIFEAVHGSAPDIAGQGVANPSAQMLAAAMMLDHLGHKDRGDRLRAAIYHAIVDDGVRTRDLGGRASTREFGDAVEKRVRA
jgi:isocitrate dehydrogenase (NAD+)